MAEFDYSQAISDARAKQAELNHTLHVLEQTLKG